MIKKNKTNGHMFTEDILFSISFRQLGFICCFLPIFGFVSCVFLAVFLHFEGSTRTHCNVPNYLPSISAAIGDYTPERYIWRFCIALHVLPRLMGAICYKNYYLSCPLRPSDDYGTFSWYNLSCWCICLLHWAENFCLLALTFVSSTENHDFHETSFILFTVFSQCYMLATLIIFNYSGRRRSSSHGEKSYQSKLFLYVVNIAFLLLSVYFFVRHNSYCEAGVYTLFALCEYVAVLSNVAFHATMCLDMGDKVLVFTDASDVGFKYS